MFQVVPPPKKLIRPSSAASSFESNHSKFSLDDDGNYSSERESHTKITHSYDASHNQPNTNARQRRRDSRFQSSIEASSPPTTNSANYESSQDSQSVEIEKKKERFVVAYPHLILGMNCVCVCF